MRSCAASLIWHRGRSSDEVPEVRWVGREARYRFRVRLLPRNGLGRLHGHAHAVGRDSDSRGHWADVLALSMARVREVKERCWALWLDTVWEICEGGQDGPALSQHIIACQLERGHAHEHESCTEIAEVWWMKGGDAT